MLACCTVIAVRKYFLLKCIPGLRAALSGLYEHSGSVHTSWRGGKYSGSSIHHALPGVYIKIRIAGWLHTRETQWLTLHKRWAGVENAGPAFKQRQRAPRSQSEDAPAREWARFDSPWVEWGDCRTLPRPAAWTPRGCPLPSSAAWLWTAPPPWPKNPRDLKRSPGSAAAGDERDDPGRGWNPTHERILGTRAAPRSGGGAGYIKEVQAPPDARRQYVIAAARLLRHARARASRRAREDPEIRCVARTRKSSAARACHWQIRGVSSRDSSSSRGRHHATEIMSGTCCRESCQRYLS